MCNFIKKRLQHRLLPVTFAKFLRAPCLTEHLQWLLLKVSGFQPATLLRKRCFAVNVAKCLRTSFILTEHLRMTVKMPTCNLTKKRTFAHPPSCILPSFSQNTTQLLLQKRLWKFESTISFWKCKRKIVLLVIYLFNYDSSRSIFFGI